MPRWILGTLLVLALVLGAVPLPQGSSPVADGVASAQEDDQRQRRRWGRDRSKDDEDDEEKKGWGRSYEVDERTNKRFTEALEHLQEDRHDEAEKALGKLRLGSLNPYERALYFRFSAYVALGREDYSTARSHLESALAEEAFPPEISGDLRYQIAQLYLAEENWPKVVESLNDYLAQAPDAGPQVYYLMAIAHYQMDDLVGALVPAQKAVDLAETPQEGWLQLLLALRLTRAASQGGDSEVGRAEYEAAIPLLEELVVRYPKKTYWINLSTVHGALGNYDEALVWLQLAYQQGLLTEDGELRRLAQLLLFLELPYRAALVMEDALGEERVDGDADAWEMLSNSWIMAREFERAVEPLERAADRLPDGRLFIRLAQVHIQREKWSEAEQALRRAMDKGGLETPCDAELLMGIVLYSQKQPQQARNWFARAQRGGAACAEAASWIGHLDREIQANASLTGG